MQSGQVRMKICIVIFLKVICQHVCQPLANISYRVGRRLFFDGATEKFIKDKAADKLLTREYREPYVVPKVV